MIERKSIIDQLEYPRNGGTGVRIALLIVDGSVEINSRWHRTFIPAGLLASTQMGEVSAHLEQMGEAAISTEDVAKVCAFHAFNNPESLIPPPVPEEPAPTVPDDATPAN